MKTHKKRMPGVFPWIRAARDKINRETEGMTSDEWCAYIHAKAEAARKNRIRLTPEEVDRELDTILYGKDTPPSSPKEKAIRSRMTKMVNHPPEGERRPNVLSTPDDMMPGRRFDF